MTTKNALNYLPLGHISFTFKKEARAYLIEAILFAEFKQEAQAWEEFIK
jgi:hypothetical protein